MVSEIRWQRLVPKGAGILRQKSGALLGRTLAENSGSPVRGPKSGRASSESVRCFRAHSGRTHRHRVVPARPGRLTPTSAALLALDRTGSALELFHVASAKPPVAARPALRAGGG